MGLSYPVIRYTRLAKSMGIMAIMVAALTMSACAGTSQVRQHALSSQQHFQQTLQSAQQFGFSGNELQAIIQQSALLSKQQPPLSLFSNQPIDDYYLSLDKKYTLLNLQLQNFMLKDKSRVQDQTEEQVQQTQALLQQAAKRGIPTHQLSALLDQIQRQLKIVENFDAYAQNQSSIKNLQITLHKSASTAAALGNLQNMIVLAQESDLDTIVHTLQTAYQHDQQDFQNFESNSDLQKLDKDLNSYYQQASAEITQAMPSIVHTRLTQLDQHIKQLSNYHIEPAPYQARLAADQSLVSSAMSIAAYQHFLHQVDTDIFNVQADSLRSEAQPIIDQFHQDMDAWSNNHVYNDPFDGNSYAIDTSYLDSNFGADADNLLQQATTLTELQNAIDDAKTLQFNHQLLEMDYEDTTPYDQVHQADLLALKHYQLEQGQVIVISLSKQSLRLYQDGNLVRAFLVTTGRAERPTPPGVWTILNRLSPTIFKSSDAPNSPYWYPNTVIQNALLFHAGGYFIHDSWWRKTYGPGSEFPHHDATGDQQDSGNGSHGCVNLPPEQAAWLYNATGWNTSVVVY
jgi:lipoprotein-anchoring transpeptidase ErfK/SrfK